MASHQRLQAQSTYTRRCLTPSKTGARTLKQFSWKDVATAFLSVDLPRRGALSNPLHRLRRQRLGKCQSRFANIFPNDRTQLKSGAIRESAKRVVFTILSIDLSCTTHPHERGHVPTSALAPVGGGGEVRPLPYEPTGRAFLRQRSFSHFCSLSLR